MIDVETRIKIEIDYWGSIEITEAKALEKELRRAISSIRSRINKKCILGVFDSFLNSKENESFDKRKVGFNENYISQSSVVDFIFIEEINEISKSGKVKVLFLDARQDFEYEKEHFPNAKHLPIDLAASVSREDFYDYDIIVPYCVKGFRGCELALRLSAKGLDNIKILMPHGLSDCKSIGLNTIITKRVV